MIKTGSIITTPPSGPIAGILVPLIKLFERGYKGEDWHMMLAVREYPGMGWQIAHSVGSGVQYDFLDDYLKGKPYKVYNWFDREIPEHELRSLVNQYLGDSYDLDVYLGTAFQYLLLKIIEWFQKTFIKWHKFKISLPRILDDQFSCWEFIFLIARSLGKPVQEAAGYKMSRYPFITDFLKGMKGEKHARIDRK